MLNKTFSVFLGVFSVIMIVLSWLAFRELQSVGFSPGQIAASYKSSASAAWLFLWLSSIVLLLIANGVFRKTLRSWAFFATLGYFVVFVLLNLWWMQQQLTDYQTQNNLPPENFFVSSGLLAPLLCVGAAVVIFLNRFILMKVLIQKTESVIESANPPETAD